MCKDPYQEVVSVAYINLWFRLLVKVRTRNYKHVFFFFLPDFWVLQAICLFVFSLPLSLPTVITFLKGQETVVESIISMEWVAQCAIYTCRVYGQKETIKFKEKEIPATLLEQYSATLLHDNQVGGQISFK